MSQDVLQQTGIGAVVGAVLVGMIIVGVPVLLWVFLWRRWRRDGFAWWMIPVGFFAGGMTVMSVMGIGCLIKGGPCEGP